MPRRCEIAPQRRLTSNRAAFRSRACSASTAGSRSGPSALRSSIQACDSGSRPRTGSTLLADRGRLATAESGDLVGGVHSTQHGPPERRPVWGKMLISGGIERLPKAADKRDLRGRLVAGAEVSSAAESTLGGHEPGLDRAEGGDIGRRDDRRRPRVYCHRPRRRRACHPAPGGRPLGSGGWPPAAWVGALPVDPGLHRFPDSPESGRGGRFAAVDFAETEDAGEIVATTHAGLSSWRSGRRIGCEPCRISTLQRRDWRSVSLIC